MNRMRFPRWLAAVGVIGGVAIALGLPYITLVLDGDLSPNAKLAVVILSLLVGATLAGISAVVGSSMPTAITGAIAVSENGVSFGRIVDCCTPKEEPNSGEGGADRCC